MGLAMSELPSEAAIPDCLQHVSFVPMNGPLPVTFIAFAGQVLPPAY